MYRRLRSVVGAIAKVTLTTHRVEGIGGNLVEVSTANTRIVLDVGVPLEELGSRKNRRARDPLVNAVFDRKPAVSAIFLSHAHADHSGLLSQIDSTPVYMTDGTRMMLLAGSVYAGGIKVPARRQKILRHRFPVQIGDITVTAHPVDHSAFDSVALEVEASGRLLLYSGDLRLHGRKPGMAKALIASMANKRVDVLLMEGTHFGAHRAPGPTEAELEQQIKADMEDAPGLVLASFSPMHIDRLVTFYKAARKAKPKREFVVDHYGAFVLHLVSQIAGIPAPRASNGIRIFLPAGRERIARIARCFPDPIITVPEILANPRKHAILFRPGMVKKDFASQLPHNVCLIYSYWDGYLSKPEWLEAQQKVSEAQGTFIKRHTSGHIFAEDIEKFVKAIKPGVVIPIHTTGSAEFAKVVPNTVTFSNGSCFPV